LLDFAFHPPLLTRCDSGSVSSSMSSIRNATPTCSTTTDFAAGEYLVVLYNWPTP
jgi:hypothetical protein